MQVSEFKACLIHRVSSRAVNVPMLHTETLSRKQAFKQTNKQTRIEQKKKGERIVSQAYEFSLLKETQVWGSRSFLWSQSFFVFTRQQWKERWKRKTPTLQEHTHICIRVCIRVCVRARARVHTNIYMYVFVRVCIIFSRSISFPDVQLILYSIILLCDYHILLPIRLFMHMEISSISLLWWIAQQCTWACRDLCGGIQLWLCDLKWHSCVIR